MEGVADQKKWKEIITPQNNIFSLNLKEIWLYRDLLLMFIRRDILAIYKQTLFGPLWFFIQPLLTTITYIIIFSRVAKLSTSSLPPALFYLSGLVLWSYFAECIIRTSTFFKDNSPILTKVYFPRLIVPFSLVLTNMIKFFIQFFLFLLVYFYYAFKGGVVHPNSTIIIFPFLLLLIAGLGLGSGMIISSLSTRYKDLIHLLNFGVQLLMFTTTVIFPLSGYANSPFAWLIKANPMTGIIEAFRYGWLGVGYFSPALLIYDLVCVLVLLFAGVIFNSVEKSFADSI